MENYATISGKVADKMKTMKQEALGQSKGYKFNTWFKTKAVPALEKAVEDFAKAISSIHINWGGILVLVILAYLAKNGFLEDMPNVKWIVDSAVRMIDWCFGLFQSFIAWFANLLDSKLVNATDIFGIFEWVANFLRDIFAL